MASRDLASIALIALLNAGGHCGRISPPASYSSSFWIAGYYAGWTQDACPPSAIDYSALTEVIHFSVLPNPDGTLDVAKNLQQRHIAPAVAAAHAAGLPILIAVGGGNSQAQFQQASSDRNRAAFVGNLVNFMRANGYDGIDVDWEAGQVAYDSALFATLIHDLHNALSAISPRPLLTAPVNAHPDHYAAVIGELDQINLMTYEMSGPYQGWITWHSSPLFSGALTFPGHPSERLPSIDGVVSAALASGVPASRLGFGIGFSGQVWTGGVYAPLQSWATPPTVKNEAYNTLVDRELDGGVQMRDATARVPYASFHQTSGANDRFISYEDPASIAEKLAYLKSRKLGGVIIWNVGYGYLAPATHAPPYDPLLQAVKANR
jgi:chitinase